MEILFARSWKMLAWRGGAGICFGLAALLWPDVTLAALVLMFGVYSLVDGVLGIAASIQQGTRDRAWAFGLEGLIGVGVGLAALLWTRMATLVIVDLIAFWGVFTGALEILAAVKLRRELPGELMLGMAGVATLGLGLFMLAWPSRAAFVLVVLLGCYAIFFGSLMLTLALSLRKLGPTWHLGGPFEGPHAV